MRITIDCRMISSSGVGVYLRGVLPYFINSAHSLLLLGNAPIITKFADIGTKGNVTIIECDIKPFSINELFLFPRETLNLINKTDVFFTPFFNIPRGIKIPAFSTIHDVIFLDRRGMTSILGYLARKFFYEIAFRKSKIIFTVSQFSASRIKAHSKKTSAVITYIAPLPYITECDNSNAQKEKIILFVGNIKEHKGLSVLLDAFSMARQEGLDYKLVIVGEKNKFRTKDSALLKRLSAVSEDEVDFSGFIDDEEIKKLYAKSALLVQPSFYEGFGLPPLEAMFLGTKALISDIPVWQEIYADFPVAFFKTGDALDLKNKMLEILFDKIPEKINLTEKQKNNYTFQKTAETLIKTMEGQCLAM